MEVGLNNGQKCTNVIEENQSLNDSYLEKGQALLEEGKVDEAIAMFGITASDSNAGIGLL